MQHSKLVFLSSNSGVPLKYVFPESSQVSDADKALVDRLQLKSKYSQLDLNPPAVSHPLSAHNEALL